MLPIEVVCEVAEFFSLQTCCRLSPTCFKLHKVVQKRIDTERWNTSSDELRCFSVLAANMKTGRVASWVGANFCWTIDEGGIASLAQAMSARGGRVSQKQIKNYLETGVKNFDWLGEMEKIYTFYPANIVKPFAIAFLSGSRGLNSAILLHISGCLELSNASREFMMVQDICHWVSEDYFNLCFKIGESFDKFTPLPVNAQVNRNAALLLLDRLSRQAGTRIVSHGHQGGYPLDQEVSNTSIGVEVSQKQIKNYLETGVKNFDWLGEMEKSYTFYPANIVKPFAIAFLSEYTGPNASVMARIAECLKLSNASREFWMSVDCCHWISKDEFSLTFKIGKNFDLSPEPMNPQVNRLSSLQLLDQLSQTAGSRIVSHGQSIYEVYID